MEQGATSRQNRTQTFGPTFKDRYSRFGCLALLCPVLVRPGRRNGCPSLTLVLHA